jgi:hypothetical protein
VEKSKLIYVLPKLENCIFVTRSFDLWMLNKTQNIFALVIIFLGFD